MRGVVSILTGCLTLTACGAPEHSPQAAIILEAMGEPYVDADLDHGAALWRACQACHSLKSDERHRVGPNLYDVFGRGAGAAASFRYSEALSTADFSWTPEQLDAWLSDPRGFLPGNRMTFSGLREASDRRDLIAYIAVETAPLD